MELRPNKERVVAELDDLDQAAVRRAAREHHASIRKQFAIVIVELEAVTMTLVHHRLTVGLGRARPGSELAGVHAETHGPALLLDVALLGAGGR